MEKSCLQSTHLEWLKTTGHTSSTRKRENAHQIFMTVLTHSWNTRLMLKISDMLCRFFITITKILLLKMVSTVITWMSSHSLMNVSRNTEMVIRAFISRIRSLNSTTTALEDQRNKEEKKKGFFFRPTLHS